MLRVTVWAFAQTQAKWWHRKVTCTCIQLFKLALSHTFDPLWITENPLHKGKRKVPTTTLLMRTFMYFVFSKNSRDWSWDSPFKSIKRCNLYRIWIKWYFKVDSQISLCLCWRYRHCRKWMNVCWRKILPSRSCLMSFWSPLRASSSSRAPASRRASDIMVNALQPSGERSQSESDL